MKFVSIFAVILFISGCVTTPRSADSLCGPKKAVKCHAPSPRIPVINTPPAPAPKPCCIQQEILMPGENAPLPKRGVSFSPVSKNNLYEGQVEAKKKS